MSVVSRLIEGKANPNFNESGFTILFVAAMGGHCETAQVMYDVHMCVCMYVYLCMGGWIDGWMDGCGWMDVDG
jgi:hypothetical protein